MKGFAAIAVVLIMSAILAALVFSASAGVFFARQNEIDFESAVAAQAYASSCIYAAIAAYEDDQSYRPNGQIVYIDAKHTCTIDALTVEDGAGTVMAHARSGDSVAAVRGILQPAENGATSTQPLFTAYFR